MAARGRFHGRPTHYDGQRRCWVLDDTGERIYKPEDAGSGQRGVCVHCGKGATPEGHDGCLGTLDESIVMNACCGHGEARMAYIQYWDRSDIRGPAAIEEQRRLQAAQGVAGE